MLDMRLGNGALFKGEIFLNARNGARPPASEMNQRVPVGLVDRPRLSFCEFDFKGNDENHRTSWLTNPKDRPIAIARPS
jgi:hypothetical protein